MTTEEKTALIYTDKTLIKEAMKEAINRKLRTACNRRPRCTYIDLWSQLSTPRERARSEYMTKDGIHLNEAGGDLVVNAIINALPQ